MLTVAFTSGAAVLTYFFDIGTILKDDQSYKRLHIIAGIILIVSGFLNIFLIKGKKKL